ncbi:MAG: HlyD family secretion protein [Legionellaceae bacterium]
MTLGINGMIIFRQEALAQIKHRQYGHVFINLPMSYQRIGFFLMFLLVGLIIFFSCAEFSERTFVKGVLHSSKGVVHLYAKRSGVIVHQWIHQGDFVKKGAPLFLIDTSDDRMVPHKNELMLRTFDKRKHALNKDILDKTAYLKKLKPLLLKHYISSIFYQEQQDALLALKDKKNLLGMELLRYQQSRAYTIRAPIDGFVSSVVSSRGQSTPSAKPLATLLPQGSFLLAELYVPARQVRFLRMNQRLAVRYDAYPYQQFGTGRAQVYEITQTVLTDALEDKFISVGEPYYKVRAYLDKTIGVDSKQTNVLKFGMTFSAEMMGVKKTVMRWLFDLLYAQRKEQWL